MKYGAFSCIALATAVVMCLYACTANSTVNSHRTSRGFYYWKSVFNLSSSEQDVLQAQGITTLYIKFFDVDWNKQTGSPVPVAPIRFNSKPVFKNQVDIIPTVFITNQCIQQITAQQCQALAQKIQTLLQQITQLNNIQPVYEIQIDCDWTARTKERYFSILQYLQQQDTLHVYSSTIRFYQIKYWQKTGVPPVKKGLLMCYNMGNLTSPVTKNSILDIAVMKQYTNALSNYPLSLDVALPLFEWMVLFRQQQYAGLIQHLQPGMLSGVAIQESQNTYRVQADTLLANVQLYKSDLLRYEDSPPSTVQKAASLLAKTITPGNRRVVLFHLDSLILKKYAAHEMEDIFNSFY
ncbi:MAG: hypothetical protein RL172_2914 [Bacteroidota bacterium]|jgi:hypothetical protein